MILRYLLFLYFPSTHLNFCSGLASDPVGMNSGRWLFFTLSSTIHPLWSPATMTFSWSFSHWGLLLYLLSYRWITGCGSPAPPPESLPLRPWPLSPCAHYSRYLIKHLDPPRSPQRATVPPLTHFPPYCVKLWKGVKQNKEGPLKDVATGT